MCKLPLHIVGYVHAYSFKILPYQYSIVLYIYYFYIEHHLVCCSPSSVMIVLMLYELIGLVTLCCVLRSVSFGGE